VVSYRTGKRVNSTIKSINHKDRKDLKPKCAKKNRKDFNFVPFVFLTTEASVKVDFVSFVVRIKFIKSFS
jgi:hypothetical protein